MPERTSRRPKPPEDYDLDDEEYDDFDDFLEFYKQFKKFKKTKKSKKLSARGDSGFVSIDNEVYQQKYINKVMCEWQDCNIIA